MHLLGAVNRHSRRQVPGEFVGASAMPAAREESVFKARFMQMIRCQEIAAVTPHPGPAGKGVEAAVGLRERIRIHHGVSVIQGGHGCG